jgi:hypothetical protein
MAQHKRRRPAPQCDGRDDLNSLPSAALPASIMIATPMYGGQCSALYVQGLLLTLQRCQQLGIGVGWSQITNEALITRARNQLVRLFLDSDAELLLFIDGDQGFDGEAIIALLAGGHDVACGVYPRKEINWAAVNRAAAAGETGSLADHAGSFALTPVAPGPAAPDAQGFVEVRHGGTGVMAIRRRVFETLSPHVPRYRASPQPDAPLVHEFFATSIDDQGVLLPEDYHFCALWRRHGGRVFAQTLARFTHVGSHVFAGDIRKSGASLS